MQVKLVLSFTVSPMLQIILWSFSGGSFSTTFSSVLLLQEIIYMIIQLLVIRCLFTVSVDSLLAAFTNRSKISKWRTVFIMIINKLLSRKVDAGFAIYFNWSRDGLGITYLKEMILVFSAFMKSSRLMT